MPATPSDHTCLDTKTSSSS